MGKATGQVFRGPNEAIEALMAWAHDQDKEEDAEFAIKWSSLAARRHAKYEVGPVQIVCFLNSGNVSENGDSIEEATEKMMASLKKRSRRGL